MGQYAFFDLDGTLIAEPSMVSFLKFYLDREYPSRADKLWKEFLQRGKELREAGASRAELNRWYYRTYFGSRNVDHVRELGKLWVNEKCRVDGFLKHPVIRLLQQHRREGIGAVLVTGSFREVVLPLAEQFGGVDEVIAAPLQEVNGFYTGTLDGPATIGEGKVLAIQRFLENTGADAALCYGYGDDDSDIPFLNILGYPRAISSGSEALLNHAREVGWPTVGDEEVEVEAFA